MTEASERYRIGTTGNVLVVMLGVGPGRYAAVLALPEPDGSLCDIAWIIGSGATVDEALDAGRHYLDAALRATLHRGTLTTEAT